MDPHDEATINRAAHPDPRDPVKPSTWRLSRRSWAHALRRAGVEFVNDECYDLAGNLTYLSVLAAFPALLALVATLSLVGQEEATTAYVLRLLERWAPASVVDLVAGPIDGLTAHPSAGWVFGFSLAIALWSASTYVAAFGRAVNRIYDVSEGRPLWAIIPWNLLLTVVLIAVGSLVVLAVLLTGDVAKAIGDLGGVGAEALAWWEQSKWLLLVAAALVFTSGLYHFTPNVRLHYRPVTVGSATALAISALAVGGFRWWVGSFGVFNATYGVIGSVIVLLLGLWLINSALLFGAEVDAEIERARQLEAGIEAEVELQLPPRSDRMVRARLRADARWVAEGRALRESTRGTPAPAATEDGSE